MTPQTTDIHSLLERYERPLVRYAQSITGDLDGARDIVQETFIKYLAHAAELAGEPGSDPAKHIESWLFTVTRNRALDYIRKHSRIIPMPLPDNQFAETTSPDEALATRESAEWLLNLLDALTPNQREVIRLKFQNDLSYKEIADITGLSVTNVGFLLHVGLKKLRELLREAPLDSIPQRIRAAI